VFDVLLQVLDDGRLTDGQGRTVDFRNTILVLTSNLGTQAIGDAEHGRAPASGRRARGRAAPLQAGVPHRLDDIVVFHSLGRQLTSIVDIQVERLAKRLAARRLILDVTPGAREWLALNGFDPIYGARPLRRLVQSAIGDKLAKQLLAGEIQDGTRFVSTFQSFEASDSLTVTRAEGAAEVASGWLSTDRRAEVGSP